MSAESISLPQTIALIDDSVELVDAIAEVLELEGFRTRKYTRAFDTVVAQLAASPPDLILLDFVLPGTNGGAILKALKAQPATRAIPVILISAAVGRFEELSATPPNAVLTKPVDVPDLLRAIEAVRASGP